MEQPSTSIPATNTVNSCLVQRKEEHSWEQPQDTNYGPSNNKILKSKNQGAGLPSSSRQRRTKKKLVRVHSTKTIQDLNQVFDWNCSTQNSKEERKQEREEEDVHRESPTTISPTGTSANSCISSTGKSSLNDPTSISSSCSTATTSRKSSSSSTIEEILSRSNGKKSSSHKKNMKSSENEKETKKDEKKQDSTRVQQQEQQEELPKASNAYKLERHLYTTNKRAQEKDENDDNDDGDEYSTSTITNGAYRQLRSTTTFTTTFRTNKRYGKGKDNISVASLPTQGLLLTKTNQVWELESLVALASVLDVAGYSQYCWEWWQKVSHKSKTKSCLGDQSSFLTEAGAKTGNHAAAVAAAGLLTQSLVLPVVNIPKSLVLHMKNQSFMQSLDEEQELYTTQHHHYMHHPNPSHHYSNVQQLKPQPQPQPQTTDDDNNNTNIGYPENNDTVSTIKTSLKQEKNNTITTSKKLDAIVESPHGESCSTIGTSKFHHGGGPEEDEISTMASSTTTHQEDGLDDQHRFSVSLLGTTGEEVY